MSETPATYCGYAVDGIGTQYSKLYWPTDIPVTIPPGVPMAALAVGIPFVDQVLDLRREPGRIVFEYAS